MRESAEFWGEPERQGVSDRLRKCGITQEAHGDALLWGVLSIECPLPAPVVGAGTTFLKHALPGHLSLRRLLSLIVANEIQGLLVQVGAE